MKLEKLSKNELIEIIKELKKNKNEEPQSISFIGVKYKSLLEAASDIIFVLDKNGNLIYINSAWKSLYPNQKQDKLGNNFINYIPDFEKERATFVVESVIKKGKVFENEVMKTYDQKGNPLYFVINFSPIKSEETGKINGLLGIMRNSTEKHLTEKKLQENTKILEEKAKDQIRQARELQELRDLNEEFINSAPIGILMIDPSGIVLNENPAIIKIMGRDTKESFVGINLLNQEGIIESGLDVLFKDCIETKKIVKAYERKYVPITGPGELILNVTLIPIYEKKGAIDKIIVMIEDITEHLIISKKMHRADKISALGYLGSGVALEIKNKINKMFMDLNFISNNIDDDNPSSEYVISAKSELEGIKGVAEQLLSLSVTDESEKEQYELNKSLSSHSVEILLHKIDNDDLEIETVPNKKNPIVMATKNQIDQIMVQLIENAEEAISKNRKGKIKIEINTEKVGDLKAATITVSDTGMGISEENQKKIFRPFFTTKGKKATGLGLMIVSTIVENLGGVIGLRTEPTVGTSFKVALPMIEKKNAG